MNDMSKPTLKPPRKWHLAESSVDYQAPDMVPAGPPEESFGLTSEHLAFLKGMIAWTDWRAQFRSKLIRGGVIRRGFRSVFEGDIILCIICDRFLDDAPITHKELTTHLYAFVTEATISRHIEDMVAMELIKRVRDEDDKRRILLIPTRLAMEFGREYLQSKIDYHRMHGFGDCPSKE